LSSSDHKSIARSASKVSVAVFISRLLGLAREQVFAWFFGAGLEADAFVVAFRIPNLLRDLFAEGALSSAFVAVFSEYDHKKGKEEARALVRNVLLFFFWLVLVVVFLLAIFAQDIVLVLAPEFQQDLSKLLLTATLTQIMSPFLLLVCLGAIFMGISNARGYFFIPALSSSFFNLFSIAVGVAAALCFPLIGIQAIYGMAIGVLAGGVMQTVVQVPIVRKEGFFQGWSAGKLTFQLNDPGLKSVLKLMLPSVIGLSATQITIFINTNFASQCGEGAVAWLSYAFRLMFFPIGLFGVALSMATLPVASRLFAQNDMENARKAVSSSLIMAFALSLPAAAGLWCLAEPIIKLLFEHGRFSADDTEMTASALRFYSLGLLGYTGVKIATSFFYALKETRWPVLTSFFAVAANLIVVTTFVSVLGHIAIALATSIAATVNLALLLLALYVRLKGFDIKHVAVSLIKILTASVVMTAVVWPLSGLASAAISAWMLVLWTFLAVLVGATAYSFCLFRFGQEEFMDIVLAVRKRLQRI